MARDSANPFLRQIRTLFERGAVGTRTDAQLVDEYLGGAGAAREAAFRALVERHGPMVLRVCRRMLPGPADGEDAFQAVFLVLARKAGSVRRPDRLEPWLHGVAVRTAKEARRRAARRRAKEGEPLDVSLAVAGPEPEKGRAEWLALLDEEMDRLPAHYRAPLLLCELEGVSRRDAAARLGLAEGTLSSRLSRGRALLRDRLKRRGLGPDAAAGPGAAFGPLAVAPSGPLVTATVSRSLAFAARGLAAGAVPAAVSQLAEGVLAVFNMTRLKLFLSAGLALGTTAGLTTALALGVGTGPEEQPPAAEPPAASSKPDADAVKKSAPRRGVLIHGVVVDQEGRPVQGAEVRFRAYTSHEARGITAADGSFSFTSPWRQLDGTRLLARSADGDRAGLFVYEYNLTREAAKAPARIVLGPVREVLVRVVDGDRAPVPGASVEAAGNFAILAHATTGPDGSAGLRLPADTKVEQIYGLKPGVGFDYTEHGPIDEAGRMKGGVPVADLPGSVTLTLERPRTARIKAVDGAGKPLAGVSFQPWLLKKEGRRSEVNFASRIGVEKTGPDGIVTFDWLPPSTNLLQFWPRDEGFAQRRVLVEEGVTEPVTSEMVRTEKLRGRVVKPDGTPAPGVTVVSSGTGQDHDHGGGQARTAEDGTYEMNLAPGEAYAVFINDEEWAAPSRLGLIVRAGEPVDEVDFKLTKGTVIRGTVTVGPGGVPVPKQYISLTESGGRAPDELRREGDTQWREVQRYAGAQTDALGRYAIRVGPGEFRLSGPARTEPETIRVKDEPELVRDFQMPRPAKGPLTGRVVAREDGRAVAGARVEFLSANSQSISGTVTADENGRFQTERWLDRTFLCAMSPDGTLGGLVEIGIEDPEVVIPVAPTATATGLLLNEAGEPAANEKLAWGRCVYLDDEQTVSTFAFAPKVVTDADGRFTLPSLVVGQEYEIHLMKSNRYLMAGVARPEGPGPLDLGTLRAGSYRRKSPANAEESSSFRKNAPDAGAEAPAFGATTLNGKPLSLDDFAGKYVLLDFWATWCGPCIAEIPQLRAVHESFGKRENFTILSLSVDEEVEKPRAFQEARKLPWPQGFLGGSVHGPTLDRYGVRAIPAFVLVGPDRKIVARGMRGADIMKEVARALGREP